MLAFVESNAETVISREAAGKPIRILLIAPARPIIGGQTVQAERLFDSLRAEKKVCVVYQPINPRFVRRLQKIKYVRTLVTSAKYLWELFRKIPKSDVIHVFSASYFSFLLAPTPAVVISRLFGKSAILHYHSGEAADHLSRWRRSAIPTIRMFAETITPSEYLVKVFADAGLPCRSIPNLIDIDSYHFRRRKLKQPIFLSNRNFEAHYNVECTLKAFAEIQRRLPHAQLLVVGDGSKRSELENLAAELRLQNVEFVGQISPKEMATVYDRAEVYLNSPDIDNMPNSIIEAFACGLPVVSTNAGGIPYIVENERTGLLVDVNDHQALANVAIRLFEEEGLAARLAAAAHNEVQKYSWQNVRQEWLRTYAELAGRSPEELGADTTSN